MLARPLGWTGVNVSVIGQGTWRVQSHRDAAPALAQGIDLGLTHIDTAELYERQSKSETLLGAVLRGRRDEAFLASKVLPQNAGYKGTKAACEASLRRLGTDHLDLYYLHWWDDEHDLDDTMRAMGELVDERKVRFVGVSNFDVDELEEAKRALGRRRIAANQVLYHLDERGIESDVIPWCERHGVAVVAYSPFGAGHFPSARSAGGKALAAVAARVGRTPRQVALAFLTRRPSVFAIPKAEKAEHVRDNAGGAFELPEDAVAELDAAFPMRPGLRSL